MRLVIAARRSAQCDGLIAEKELLITEFQALKRDVVAAVGIGENRGPVAGSVERLGGIKARRARALGEVSGQPARSDVDVGDKLSPDGAGAAESVLASAFSEAACALVIAPVLSS